MIVLDAGGAAIGVVVAIDVAPQDLGAVMQTSLAPTQQFVASRTGFGGGTWLIRDPLTPGSDTAGTERVTQYVQWDKRSHADAFLADPTRDAGFAGLRSGIAAADSEVYHLREVISATEVKRASTSATFPGSSRRVSWSPNAISGSPSLSSGGP